MRKPVLPYANNKGADQTARMLLCYSLLRKYNTSSFYIRNFGPLASLYCRAGLFEYYLVANPEDRFSRDVAHFTINSAKMSRSLAFPRYFQGYYRRLPEYLDIVERKAVGCFEVSMVHTVLLVNLRHKLSLELAYTAPGGYNKPEDDINLFSFATLKAGMRQNYIIDLYSYFNL